MTDWIGVDVIKSRRCPTCGEKKTLDLWGKNRSTKSGLAAECKACALARTVAYQRANPEAHAATVERSKPVKARRMATYRAANADRIKARNKVYDFEHREQSRAWRAANKEHVLAERRKWGLAHADEEKVRKAALYANRREHYGKLREAWKLANAERVREMARQHTGKRRAQMRGVKITKVDYAQIIAEYGMVCHICGDEILDMDRLDMDHVIPLALGGEHSIENLRPSHQFCNRSKGARIA